MAGIAPKFDTLERLRMALDMLILRDFGEQPAAAGAVETGKE